MVAEDLTTQAQPRLTSQSFCGEDVLLRLRDLLRFARDELDSAGRAARESAARVHLIDLRVILQGVHKPLAGRDFEFADAFHGELWHGGIIAHAIIADKVTAKSVTSAAQTRQRARAQFLHES